MSMFSIHYLIVNENNQYWTGKNPSELGAWGPYPRGSRSFGKDQHTP